MPELRTQIIDGRAVVIQVEHDPGHVNPKLTDLNTAYLTDQNEQRNEVNSAVRAAGGAIREVLTNGLGRRSQKNLRPRPAA